MFTPIESGNPQREALPIPYGATAPGSRTPVWQELEEQMVHNLTTWRITYWVRTRTREVSQGETATEPTETGELVSDSDETKETEDEFVFLELAAEEGDETAFIEAARKINWARCSAAEFERGVRLALTAGAHLVARNLATKGAKSHHHHQELQKFAHVLAPPRVLRADLPPDPSIRANQQWLQMNRDQYRGKWVAIKDGQLLAYASSIAELKQALKDLHGVMITKVM